jgi:hypothetical protein
MGVYDPLSFHRYALIVLQLVGIILFLFGSGGMLFFLLTQRGLDFIASAILKWMH